MSTPEDRHAPDSAATPPTASTETNSSKSLWKRSADKFMTGKGIFTFLRSSVSSQIASWIDMGVCFVFYAWVFIALGKDPMRSFLATAIGLVAGGVVNCCINYKFTFRAGNCSVKAVAVKYFLIWGGSFILNIAGTTILTHLLQGITWFEHIGIKADGLFAAARLSVSLIVSLAWNFLLQKNFVYVPTRFDPYAIRIVDFITFRHKKADRDKAA